MIALFNKNRFALLFCLTFSLASIEPFLISGVSFYHHNLTYYERLGPTGESHLVLKVLKPPTVYYVQEDQVLPAFIELGVVMFSDNQDENKEGLSLSCILSQSFPVALITNSPSDSGTYPAHFIMASAPLLIQFEYYGSAQSQLSYRYGGFIGSILQHYTPTMPLEIANSKRLNNVPVYGVVGSLSYPLPQSAMNYTANVHLDFHITEPFYLNTSSSINAATVNFWMLSLGIEVFSWQE